jgi:cellulose synthase/poly-beta-1,6-N-acetylglucosamine synthase-like glycosyltransferase
MLMAAVESLVPQLRPADELIVVDSASREPVAGIIGDRDFVRVVRLEVPGTSRARNAGFGAASASIVAFIDDDVVVAPSWVSEVGRAFDDSAVGFVTGRAVTDRDAKLPVSAVVGEQRRRFDPEGDPSHLGGGVNMAFRRTALEGIGGFDEGMGPATRLRAAEDHDVFWRLLRAGWRGVYEPSIVVTHRQWRTTGQAIRRQYAYGVGAGGLAVKMIRSRDRRGWRMLRKRFWDEGVAMSGKNLVRGYQSGSAGAAVKTVGVLVGATRASRLTLANDRFAG